MSSRGIQFLSLTTFPIDVLDINGTVCGKATGFFYSKNESDIFIITNWHVVTGRKPHKPTESKNGAIPCTLRCKLHKKVADNAIQLNQKMQLDITINTQDGNKPEWLEHPFHKFKADVVVVKIKNDKEKEQLAFNLLSDCNDFTPEYEYRVMDDVFVLGYPWGLSGGNTVLPLYKRGSIASEPIVSYLNLPRFLIDCRTAEGMSGGPVIVSHRGLWSPTPDDSRTLKGNEIIGTITKFAGIYSGRLESSELEEYKLPKDAISEIGIVWTQNVIDEIINNGVSGTPLMDLI